MIIKKNILQNHTSQLHTFFRVFQSLIVVVVQYRITFVVSLFQKERIFLYEYDSLRWNNTYSQNG